MARASGTQTAAGLASTAGTHAARGLRGRRPEKVGSSINGARPWRQRLPALALGAGHITDVLLALPSISHEETAARDIIGHLSEGCPCASARCPASRTRERPRGRDRPSRTWTSSTCWAARPWPGPELLERNLRGAVIARHGRGRQHRAANCAGRSCARTRPGCCWWTTANTRYGIHHQELQAAVAAAGRRRRHAFTLVPCSPT